MLIHREQTVKKEGSHFIVLQWDKYRYKMACKVSWMITLAFNHPLGICILSQKERTQRLGQALAVQVGAHPVSWGSIPGAKSAWGTYCPNCPYRSLKYDFKMKERSFGW